MGTVGSPEIPDRGETSEIPQPPFGDLQTKFQSVYHLKELCVDEAVCPFKRRSHFHVHMNMKDISPPSGGSSSMSFVKVDTFTILRCSADNRDWATNPTMLLFLEFNVYSQNVILDTQKYEEKAHFPPKKKNQQEFSIHGGKSL